MLFGCNDIYTMCLLLSHCSKSHSGCHLPSACLTKIYLLRWKHTKNMDTLLTISTRLMFCLILVFFFVFFLHSTWPSTWLLFWINGSLTFSLLTVCSTELDAILPQTQLLEKSFVLQGHGEQSSTVKNMSMWRLKENQKHKLPMFQSLGDEKESNREMYMIWL